ILEVFEHPAAYAHYHRRMPAHEGSERTLLPMDEEALQELRIGQASALLPQDCLTKVPEYAIHSTCSHATLSPERLLFSYGSLPRTRQIGARSLNVLTDFGQLSAYSLFLAQDPSRMIWTQGNPNGSAYEKEGHYYFVEFRKNDTKGSAGVRHFLYGRTTK